MSENTCPACGTQLVNSGAPIWEDYCPNKECTYDHDEFIALVKTNDTKRAAENRLRDAAPDMLTALKNWLAYAEENLMEFDDDCEGEAMCPRCQSSGCISYKIRAARAAIDKATGSAS